MDKVVVQVFFACLHIGCIHDMDFHRQQLPAEARKQTVVKVSYLELYNEKAPNQDSIEPWTCRTFGDSLKARDLLKPDGDGKALLHARACLAFVGTLKDQNEPFADLDEHVNIFVKNASDIRIQLEVKQIHIQFHEFHLYFLMIVSPSLARLPPWKYGNIPRSTFDVAGHMMSLVSPKSSPKYRDYSNFKRIDIPCNFNK